MIFSNSSVEVNNSVDSKRCKVQYTGYTGFLKINYCHDAKNKQ